MGSGHDGLHALLSQGRAPAEVMGGNLIGKS